MRLNYLQPRHGERTGSQPGPNASRPVPSRPGASWRVVCGLLLALPLLLPACGGVPPPCGPGSPPPCPQPTPTPPSPCKPGDPAPCPQPVTVHDELLLGREGSRFVGVDGKAFRVKLDARCCSTDEGEPDPHWSIGSKEAIDDAAAKGATVITMRLGPFRIGADWSWGHEIGGAYLEVGDPAVAGVVGGRRRGANRFPWRGPIRQPGLIHPETLSTRADLAQWNPAFWAMVDEIVGYAESKGLRIEVDVDDGWGVKHCKRKDIGDYHPWQRENNVQGQDLCDAAGTIEVQPGDPFDKWIRKVVEVLGKHGGVIWQIGNEDNLIPGFSPAWELSHAAIIKDEELRRGYKAHPIGTQTENPGIIADPRIDFSEWHTGGTAINLANCQGKPCGVNEYNPDPPLTAGAVQESYCAALANGTWFGLWRHSMSRPSWDEAWRLVGEGCGTVPPPPSGCLPPGEDGRWAAVCKARADIEGAVPVCSALGLSDQKAAVLSAAESKAVADNPTLFSGSCLRELSETNLIRGLHAIGAAARSAGECGGRKDDAVFLRRNDGAGSDQYWQEEHALAWSTGCFTQVNNAFKFIWKHPPTDPTPPPPPPPPPGGACPLTLADITEWRPDLKPHPETSQQLDLTVNVCGPNVRAKMVAAGASCGLLTACCPLASELGAINLACQNALYGTAPDFRIVGEDRATLVHLEGRPFAIKVSTGQGWLIAPGNGGGPATRTWWVHATAPACDIPGPGQFCNWHPYQPALKPSKEEKAQ